MWCVNTYNWETACVRAKGTYGNFYFLLNFALNLKLLSKEVYLKTELYPEDEIKSKRTVSWIGESHFVGWEENVLTAARPIHSHFSIQPTETNLGDTGRVFSLTCVGHIRHGPEGFGWNPSSAILWFRVCHFSKLRCFPNLWRLNDHICSTAL